MKTPDATVFVVDDDEAVRQGLGALLRAKGYGVEAFASADEFLAAMPSSRPACLLVDIRMPGMSGLELQREMKRRDAALPVVVVTGHGDVPAAVAALKAGAVDFLEKPFDADALLAAVSEGLRKAAAVAAGVKPDFAALAERVAGLTPREREVMELVVAGQPNKVIAHRLAISLRTVEIHRARVMDKTGVKSLADLVRLAVQLEAAAN
ncbi:MAG: response regulator transcription factor [Rhodospirillaceae bacterium]|nr:response regulator transcription factor [Rhodospirillaceae bacterium]